MSKSLEALDNLYLGLCSENEMSNYYSLIKQDLERLELIEKENQELKEEKEKWRKLCLCWREAYIECDEKFHNLLKEVLKDE